jgi:hypothetical protein
MDGGQGCCKGGRILLLASGHGVASQVEMLPMVMPTMISVVSRQTLLCHGAVVWAVYRVAGAGMRKFISCGRRRGACGVLVLVLNLALRIDVIRRLGWQGFFSLVLGRRSWFN